MSIAPIDSIVRPAAGEPAALEPATVIDVRAVTQIYRSSARAAPVVANDQLDLRIFRGEVFGLLGPNGAGKTTLVRQMMGLLVPSAGNIYVEGVDVTLDPQRVKRRVGFLPQSGVAMRLIEVERALYFTGRLRGQSAGDARRQTARLLDELELAPLARRRLHQLSGGQIRLVHFGMTLMGQPSVLILDEPTNELDPRNRRLIWDTIGRLSRNDGVTTLLVTHNVAEAERVMDRVAIMQRGRIARVGTPGELKKSVDRRVKIEWRTQPGAARETRTGAPRATGVVRTSSTAHQLLVEPERLAQTITSILATTALDTLEDFRLAPPSLEDVYLRLDSAALEPAQPPAAAKAHAGATPVQRTKPSEPLARRWRQFGVCLKYLFLEQALGLRRTWVWSAVFSILMPLAMVFGLARMGRGLSDSDSLLYIVTGSAIFAVTTEGLLMIAQRVGLMRENGTLTYYASLPISNVALVLALLTTRFGLILPGLITPIVAGSTFYDVSFQLSAWVLPVLLLTSWSFASLGMTLGLVVRSLDVIVLLSNLILFVVLLAAPVMIPAESLPVPLQILGRFLPPSYAADALRRVLTARLDATFYWDILVLCAIIALSSYAIAERLRWRV